MNSEDIGSALFRRARSSKALHLSLFATVQKWKRISSGSIILKLQRHPLSHIFVCFPRPNLLPSLNGEQGNDLFTLQRFPEGLPPLVSFFSRAIAKRYEPAMEDARLLASFPKSFLPLLIFRSRNSVQFSLKAEGVTVWNGYYLFPMLIPISSSHHAPILSTGLPSSTTIEYSR